MAGFIACDPEEETLPTPLSIVTVVALETDQLSTEEVPVVMLEGFTVKLLIIGAAGAAMIVTVAVRVMLPLVLVAVSV